MSSDQNPQINLKQSSDEELVKIITVQVHHYEPHTVKAAEAEIERRGIDKMRMAHLVKKVAQENTAVQEIQDYVTTTWMRFVNFLIDSLDQIGFLQPQHKRKSMIENIRTIFHKMNLSDKEMRILLGIFGSLKDKKVD